jgi:hypothetical protein
MRFSEAVKKSDAQAKAERKRIAAERKEAKRLAKIAADHAEAVRVAGLTLDKAIAAAKAAHHSGKGVEQADLAWRDAKARVIELDTGERPDWAPADPDAADPDAADTGPAED